MEIDPASFAPERVDPETRAANEKLEALLATAPSIDQLEPAVVRAARESGQSIWGPVERLPHAESRTIPGPAGDLPVRILRCDEPQGVYLHLHGGGWTLGSESQHDPKLDALARAARVTVMSVGYRLAPEHPYPEGPDDCEAAALWLLAHARGELGSGRLVIGGESAGAHLAVITLLRMRERHGVVPFRAANLVYGCYDLTLTPSARRWGERNLVLSTPILECFLDHFVADPGLRAHPDVSPLFADLAGLPPALFTVGTLDPLLDDTLFMALRWEAAGNRAEVAIHPGGVHGFDAFPTGLARRAVARCHAFVAEAVEGAGP